MSLTCLSFCDPALPKGARFLGAVFMYARPMDEAMKWAWRLGINPGGEVLCLQLEGKETLGILPSELDRLLTREECDEIEARRRAARMKMGTILPAEEREALLVRAQRTAEAMLKGRWHRHGHPSTLAENILLEVNEHFSLGAEGTQGFTTDPGGSEGHHWLDMGDAYTRTLATYTTPTQAVFFVTSFEELAKRMPGPFE